MLRKKTIQDVDVTGKRVLVRVDFNVPLNGDGSVLDNTRIKAVLPTIDYLLSHHAKVILASHLGRPGGKVDERLRLDPVAKELSNLLGREVRKIDKTVTNEVVESVRNLQPSEILLLENVRFNPGEKKNDPEFAKNLASLADVYVDDAFGAAHRAHASTVGVTNYLPSVAGLLLQKEVETLGHMLDEPERPFLALLGGNKVSDKIGVISKFLDIVDLLLTGGGMCFTFLKAKGYNIGSSICQEEEVAHCQEMLEKAERNGKNLYLPVDVVAASALAEDADCKVVPVDQIPPDWKGLDIGPRTIEMYKKAIEGAKTIFWNGPMGVFEMNLFANGTKSMAEAVTNSPATTIIGGGDTDAALRKFGLEDKVTFVSTGGGASLKMLEGTPLPGVEVLMDK